MRLTRVQIHHYKSLSEVEVELHPQVTVLVGPNATGKSNFVDALRFMRDATRDGLDHAIVARGGLPRIRQMSSGRPFNVGLAVDALQSNDKDIVYEATLAHYGFSVCGLTGGNYRVEREIAQCLEPEWITDEEGGETLEWLPHGFSRNKSGTVSETNVHPEHSFTLRDTERLALGSYAPGMSLHSLCSSMQSYIADWQFTSLYPNILRQPATPDTDTQLREDGSNWASVIRAAKRTVRGRRMLERIYEMMRAILPGFLDVHVKQTGHYLVPYFRFGDTESSARLFDPGQLSDGSLRIFGILLSLYQTPEPALIVIEEPEQTVHPAVLSVLAEAFKEVSETTQVLITTHSPQLIEHFEPEHIRVVTMPDGMTRISPLKSSQRDAVQRGLMGLSEFMAAEGLQPEQP